MKNLHYGSNVLKQNIQFIFFPSFSFFPVSLLQLHPNFSVNAGSFENLQLRKPTNIAKTISFMQKRMFVPLRDKATELFEANKRTDNIIIQRADKVLKEWWERLENNLWYLHTKNVKLSVHKITVMLHSYQQHYGS